MILSLFNNSSETIKVNFCNGDKYELINPFEKRMFNIDDSLIELEISSCRKSNYRKLLKKTEFQVLSKYWLLNRAGCADITILKQEVEDEMHYSKYIGFVCQNENLFSKIEYTVVDYEDIENKEKKSNLLYYLVFFIENFFSKANVMFIAICIVVGKHFGIGCGIICYLIISFIFFTILFIIQLHNDKHISPVDELISHEYISNLFANAKMNKK